MCGDSLLDFESTVGKFVHATKPPDRSLAALGTWLWGMGTLEQTKVQSFGSSKPGTLRAFVHVEPSLPSLPGCLMRVT